jgi:acetyl esterase/lipase
MKIKNIIAYALLIISVAACSKNTDTPAISVAEKTELNVTYGNDPLQKFDVYLPKDRTTTTTKAIILIHGGAWISGDKADFAATVDSLKKSLPTYAIFNVNYRLASATGNNFPTQETDINTVVNQIYANRAQYQISDKFVLAGASAGGQLAMLQAYKYPTQVPIKAVVTFFGPTDMTDLYNNPPTNTTIVRATIAQAVGATPTANPSIYNTSSPLRYVNAQCPPTILLHGGLDQLVNASQSRAVRDALTTFNIANQYVFYPNGDHGNWDNATYADAYAKITLFVNANVR